MSTPAIAQLVEHLTVEVAAIRWSLVRFRVAGVRCLTKKKKTKPHKYNNHIEKNVKTMQAETNVWRPGPGMGCWVSPAGLLRKCRFLFRARGVVVPRPLCMRQVPGAISGVPIGFLHRPPAARCTVVARACTGPGQLGRVVESGPDSLAEWSTARAQGASPQWTWSRIPQLTLGGTGRPSRHGAGCNAGGAQ